MCTTCYYHGILCQRLCVHGCRYPWPLLQPVVLQMMQEQLGKYEAEEHVEVSRSLLLLPAVHTRLKLDVSDPCQPAELKKDAAMPSLNSHPSMQHLLPQVNATPHHTTPCHTTPHQLACNTCGHPTHPTHPQASPHSSLNPDRTHPTHPPPPPHTPPHHPPPPTTPDRPSQAHAGRQ